MFAVSSAVKWLKSSRGLGPLLSLVVILAPACLAANLTSLPLFKEGVQAYNNRSYSEALKKFNVLIQSGHDSDMVHYYMALCYQGQNQIAQAKSEFSLVSTQSTDPGLRANAQRALASIDKWSAHRSYQGNSNIFRSASRVNRVLSADSIEASLKEAAAKAADEPPMPISACKARRAKVLESIKK